MKRSMISALLLTLVVLLSLVPNARAEANTRGTATPTINKLFTASSLTKKSPIISKPSQRHNKRNDEHHRSIEAAVKSNPTIAPAKGISNNTSRGLACIIGGALAHLTLGTFYCWGNFLSYSPPYLRYFTPELPHDGPPDALYVMPFTLIAQALTMPFGPHFVKHFGASKTLLFGCWLAAFAVYIASFQTRLWPFIAFYSLLFGTGVGLAYTAPMSAGWKWLPSYKGLVSGGILAGFGAGGFVFSMIGSRMVNPKGLNPVQGKFPQAVYDAFPLMLRRLAGAYAIISLIGACVVSEPKQNPIPKISEHPIPSTSNGLSVKEAIGTSQFWLMWMMIITSATGCLNTAVIYKQFAATSKTLDGDSYQAMVGGIGALFNGVGRLFWGSISDKIGFKTSFSILTILQLVLMMTYSFASSSKMLFATNTCLLYFCLAGNLALMPSATVRMFGSKAGTTIYGVLYSAFAIASVAGGMLTKSLVKSHGYSVVFQVMAAMSLIASLVVTQLKPVKHLDTSQV